MDYLETISVASFVMGGFSLIIGVFLSILGPDFGFINTNILFYFGFGLWIFFWVIAIGVKSYSKQLK